MDFPSTSNGDMKLDSSSPGMSPAEFVQQRVLFILRSKPGDWAYAPDKGAYLPRYIGYPNIPATKTLVEKELKQELDRDSVIGILAKSVEYTPITRDTAIVEIKVWLPDGTMVQISEALKTTGSMIGTDGTLYTQPNYDTTSPVVKAEVVDLLEDSNTVEVQHLPINTDIIILPIEDALTAIDEDGNLSIPSQQSVMTYDLTSGNVMAVPVSGETLSVLDESLVLSSELNIDGEPVPAEDFTISDGIIQFLPQYADTDGTYHGFTSPPSGTLEYSVTYRDSVGIAGIATADQDAVPGNAFPRSRRTTKNIIATNAGLKKGKHFVQYLTYPLVGG